MRRPTILPVLLVTCALIPCGAETGGVQGPMSGFLFDSQTSTIRPVIGAPGAAYLGDSITGPLDAAFVAADGSRALAAGGGRMYLLRGLNTGSLDWVELGELQWPLERVAWSSGAAVAAVYAGGRIAAWHGLDGPGARAAVDLGDVSLLGGRLASLAVAPDGAVLAGIEGLGVYLLQAGEAPALLATAENPAGIALAGDGRDLYVADRARQEVIEIRGYRSAPDAVLFAGQGQGVVDPVALAVSQDSRTLTVASGSGRRLIVYDRATRGLEKQFELDFEPSRLDSMGAGSILLLNTRGAPGEVLQVYEEGPDPGVYFVPAGAQATGSMENNQ